MLMQTCLKCAGFIWFDIGKDSEVQCFLVTSKGGKWIGKLHISKTKSIILAYNPVLKMLGKPYEMKTIVKISKVVMK